MQAFRLRLRRQFAPDVTWCAPLAIALTLCLPNANLRAQQLPETQLLSIFPPGAKAGTTVDLTITGGKELADVGTLYLDHPEITAVQKTTELAGLTRPVPQQFTVTVGPNVPAGRYEIRAGGSFGVSNPRTFVVSGQNEVLENDANNSFEQAMEIPLGDVVNGRSNGNRDVDLFKFQGKQGQRVLVECNAAAIDSQLKATLRLLDAAGRQLGYSRQRLGKDPLLDVTLPADGSYFVKVHDFIFNGGDTYVYRLKAHAGPYIDFVLPPAGVPGSNSQYTVYGRNLPGGQPAEVSVDGRPLEKLNVQIALPSDPTTLELAGVVSPPEAGLDGIRYALDSPSGQSNAVLIQFSSAPVALEQEPNDEPAQANPITVPGEFAGQFAQRADVDYVTFEAKAGQVYFVEVFGERHGNFADPYFLIERVTKNDQGEETVNRIPNVPDDNATNLLQNIFNTATNDPVFRFQVPADGTYRIALRDRYSDSRGDARLVYRLAIRAEQPDYRLVALTYSPGNNNASEPGAIILRKGDNVSIQVLAFRRDGFNDAIHVSAEGLPEGVVCKGAVIGAGQTAAELVFTSTEDAAEWYGPIHVVGKTVVDDPQKVRAVAEAQSAIKPASDALPKLNEDAQKAAEALNKANAELAAAKEELGKSPDDEGLKKKVEDATKAVEAAQQAADNANQAKAAGEKRLADAQAAVQQAEAARQAAAKEVAHKARAATVVWRGDQNTPAVARISQSLGLSVIKEAAYFQITTDVFEVDANQGRQVLVPVKLAKRNGFDNNVNLQFVGLPNNANIAVQNKPIPKGQDSELYRLFVNNNAPEGTHTVYLRGQGQIAYQYNTDKVERLKKEQEQISKVAAEAAEAAKQAAQKRDEANKNATDAANTVKTAETAKSQAETQSKSADEALQKAAAEKTAAEKAAADAEAAAKQAAQKAEEAKKVAEADPDNKELADAQAAAEKASADAAEAAKKAADAKAAAEKKFTEADDAAKKAAETLAGAQKALEEAQKALETANQQKTEAEQLAKQADDNSKSLASAKGTIDKEVLDATNAAKPNNRNITLSSTPIIITVKKAPVQLSAAVPNGGNLKRGESLEVKVTVKRINDFAGPVALSLPLPPGVEGLSAPEVTIPADQTEGVLTIAAAGEATEGQLQNMVVRGTMDYDGKAAVDAPINLKISK